MRFSALVIASLAAAAVLAPGAAAQHGAKHAARAPSSALPSLAEPAAAPAPARSMRGVNALSGDAAPLLPGAIPLGDAAAAAAAAATAGAAAGPQFAAYQFPPKFAYKKGIPLQPAVSGVPQAAPTVTEVSGVPKMAKIVPVYVKPGAAPQVVLERKQLLPARAIQMPAMNILLPGQPQRAAPVSGVSGVPMKQKVLAALGGK